MRSKSIFGYPRHIRHLDSISGFHGAFRDHATARLHVGQFTRNLGLQSSMPDRNLTHHNLIKSVRLNLVRRVLQSRKLANLFPRAHASKCPALYPYAISFRISPQSR
jgi:hypothetical protein